MKVTPKVMVKRLFNLKIPNLLCCLTAH